MRADLRTYLVGDDGTRVFGPGPAELLERVGELGSLRAAAIDMRMAYTKAMRIVRDAEAALGFPLTERTVGGTGGGGSRLTDRAQDLLVRYRDLELANRRDLERNYRACFSGLGDVDRLGCVVMASGVGERFGGAPGDKLLAEAAGVAVLERTLAALPADELEVVVVTRWEGVAALCERLGVRCVRHAGTLKSDTVREGLCALGERAGCLFVPGDQPLLAERSVRAVCAAFRAEPTAIVRLAWQGRPASPILWPADELDALARIGDDAGGLALLAGRGELEKRVRLVEAACEEELWDVDTTDDLARIEEELLRRRSL